MQFPEGFRYTKDHEWAEVKDNTVRVGITDHAQSALGDVVFVELPEVGRELQSGETFGVVESIKAVSDLYAPLSGKITAINEALIDNPAMINENPHGEAWLVEIEMSQSGDVDALMDVNAYTDYVKSLD